MNSSHAVSSKRKSTSMLERVSANQPVDISPENEDEDDRLFRPWKMARLPSAELILIFENGNSRSIPYSDQKGVWHGGDTIIAKYAEESVLFVIFRGQNIGELARGLAKRTIEWVETIDESRAQVVERHKNYLGKNVFSINIVKRRWGDECEWDPFFDDPETA